MQQIGTKIKSARKKLGYNQAELAQLVEVSTQAISQYERGETRPKYEVVLKLNEILNINLFDGNNSVAEPDTDTYKVNKEIPRIEAEPLHLAAGPDDYYGNQSKFEELPDGTIRMRIPIIPYKAFAAGYLQGFRDPIYYDDLEYTSIEVFKKHQGFYLAFEVKGDSMTTLEPEHFRQSIFDGVKVVGRFLPRQQWVYKLHTHNWDAWVIVHKEKGILIKQIIAQDVARGVITIHSLNPDKETYPDEDLYLDDIEQIFNVVKKIDD